MGAHRYFWNKAKAFADKAYDEAKWDRIIELEKESVSGVCCKDGKCCKPINDPDAEPGRLDRYFCATHAKSGALQVKARHNGNNLWSPITLREAVMTNDKDLAEEDLWQREIPYDTRQGAIRKYMDAVSSFFERKKKHPESEMPGYLSKKSQRDSMFALNKDAISFGDKGLSMFTSRMKGVLRMNSKSRKRVAKHFGIEGSMKCDPEVIRTYAGEWYIVLPRKIPQEKNTTTPSLNMAFLDPGGRTFQTVYSPDGVAMKLGDKFYNSKGVKESLIKSDKLMSKAAKLKGQSGLGRKVKNILIRAQTLRTKVKNTVRDLHRKSCRFLCDNFKTICIPKFDAAGMSHVGRRSINSKAVRNLTTFAHSEFRNKLTEYAKRRGVKVFIVSEAWTTKTCTFCGHVNDVAGETTVKCNHCHKIMDRDLGAGRNIGLRFATYRP